MRLEGKVACITGGAGGLGLSMAEHLAKEGAIIAVNDVNPSAVDQAVLILKDKGYTAHGFTANVASKEEVISMFSGIIDTYGRIDILVNNAGGSLRTPKKLEEIKEEHWDMVLDVNLKGTFLCSQAVVEHMKKTGGGKIINVASIGGRTASIVTGVAYAAAKGGVISFTRRLASEVGPYSINVNAVAPGLVLSGERMQDTWDHMDHKEQSSVLEDIPLRNLPDVSEIATVVEFLASEQSKYMTGVILDVNGGRFMG